MNDTTPYRLSNSEFLQTVFGEYWQYAHCTLFPQDPVAGDWAGNWAKGIAQLDSDTCNSYYTISLFTPSEDHRALRRKELFYGTYVIMIDDMGSKINSFDAVALQGIPDPSYRIETSPGNEQWGYLLDQPCTSQAQVDALLHAITGKLAGGIDTGMKGTTRYARLPQGTNTKDKYRGSDGSFPHHRLVEWRPQLRFTMDGLARVFNINLGDYKHDTESERYSGTFTDADLRTHPVLSKLHVKKRLRTGVYDVTCPWVRSHSDAADNGAAVMVRPDNSVGFQCHHGHCENRSGNDLVNWLQFQHPEMDTSFQFAPQRKMMGVDVDPETAFSNVQVGPWKGSAESDEAGAHEQPTESDRELCHRLCIETNLMVPGDDYRPLMRQAVGLDAGYKEELINSIHARLQISKGALKQDLDKMVRAARKTLGRGENEVSRVLDAHVYISTSNRFIHKESGESMAPEALWHSYSYLGEALKEAIATKDGILRVENLSFDPDEDEVFVRRGARYWNTWKGLESQGMPGDVKPWLSHIGILVPIEREREHLLDWMSFTLQHPEEKINHCLVWGSEPGAGKDTILHPLTVALGDRSCVQEQAGSLLSDFNDYLAEAKLLIFQEASLGEHSEGASIDNKLKPLIAAPPHTLRVNLKGLNKFSIRNIVNLIMTTNDDNPLPVFNGDRRYFMIWSDLKTMSLKGEIFPKWRRRFDEIWAWLENEGGSQFVINYLLSRDVTGFNAKSAPPMSEFKHRTIARNTSKLAYMVEDMLDHGLLEANRQYSTADLYTIVSSNGTDLAKYGFREPPSVRQIGQQVGKVPGAMKSRTRDHKGWEFSR